MGVGSGLLKKRNFISSIVHTHVYDTVDLAVRVQSTRAEVVGSSPGPGEKQACRERDGLDKNRKNFSNTHFFLDDEFF